jgi:hypothetical protein
LEILRVKRQQGGDLTACRVSHQENPPRISAELFNVGARPGGGGILHGRGEHHRWVSR